MPYKFNDNLHTYGNRSTHSHIAHTPVWFFPIRILQAILALVTLALSAFIIDWLDVAYDAVGWSGPGLNIWTSILTFIFLAYVFLTGFRLVRFYNNWAVLALETLCVIFWLITFSVLAHDAREANLAKNFVRVRGRDKDAINSLTAASVLSAFNFVLFVITLAFFALSLNKHRRAGNPMVAGGTTTGGVGNHKLQNVTPATGTAQPSGHSVEAVGDQQYPPAAYNQPAYNQQGHQVV